MFPRLKLWGRHLLSISFSPFNAAEESSKSALATVRHDIADREMLDDSRLSQL